MTTIAEFQLEDPSACRLVREAIQAMEDNEGVLPTDVHARLASAGLIVADLLDT